MSANLLALFGQRRRSARQCADDRRSGGRSIDRSYLRALTFALALVGIALSDPAAHAQDPIKIMPLGDSITVDDRSGGYRHLLYDLLTQDGISFKFVGSAKSGDVPDAHHEGHPGWRI